MVSEIAREVWCHGDQIRSLQKKEIVLTNLNKRPDLLHTVMGREGKFFPLGPVTALKYGFMVTFSSIQLAIKRRSGKRKEN